MDRPGAPDHRHRRPAASLSDRLAGVCLERTVELDNVRLQVRDWPGLGGPVLFLPDPLTASTWPDRLAAALQPRFRVLSVSPRPDSPYQADVIDLVGVIDQFGFDAPVLVGEGLGCVTALLVAGWFPGRVGRLVLVDPVLEAGGDSIAARALRDCQPDWASLRSAVRCPVLEASALDAIEDFLLS